MIGGPANVIIHDHSPHDFRLISQDLQKINMGASPADKFASSNQTSLKNNHSSTMEKGTSTAPISCEAAPTDLEPKTTYGFNEDLYSNQLTETAKSGAEVEQHLPPLQAIKAYLMKFEM
ncbi:hypothetical protein V1505DRAFT_382113 [Lipomyces doorenjongii]